MTSSLPLAWWAQWLPFAARSVVISETGIELRDRRCSRAFSWSDLPHPPGKLPFLFTQAVTVKTKEKTWRLYFGNRQQSDAAWHQIAKAWYGPRLIESEIRQQRIEAALSDNRYIRSSQWAPFEQELNSWRNQFPPVPPQGVLPPKHYNQLLAAKELILLSRQRLEQARETYVQKTLDRHQKLFDTVETKPLSTKQRRACVIDEDNNLILAGAGTGKTSTVIGRVAFLVQSGQARPEEILLLAYGSAAAEEMRERLEKRLGIKGVTAETFHALGRRIVEKVEQKEQLVSPLATDKHLKAKFVDQVFQALQQSDPAYRQLLLTYFERWLYPVQNPFDFETLGDYFRFLEDNDVRTLKAEKVKGFGECDIANFLFRNGIEYQYEAFYPVAEQAEARGPYKPDFFLPEHGIYIEHFGIDRKGNTAPYIDRQQYQADMAWKRKVHEQQGTRLVETFHYEKQEGCLLEALEQRLTAAGVRLNPLPPEALLETLREFGVVSQFSTLLAEMLGLLKAANMTARELLELVQHSENPQQVKAALDLLAPVFKAYERELSENDQVDFDDMINKATQYVLTGDFSRSWKYIVVDEFQDIAKSRAHLVQTLRQKQADISLFCVGDDWQAIYRFAGSDISYTSQFQERFGATAVSELDKTFRFNSKIGEVASRFVMRNRQQLVKQIGSHAQADAPTVSLLRTAQSTETAIVQVVERINEIAAQGSSVYFLARFRHDLPKYHELRQLERQYPKLSFKTDSIHGSKGKEADYVILLGLSKGKYGLPSEIATHPLIEALLPAREAFPHAEERRLFYVALTRAKHRVYLICDMRKASPFVQELIKDGYPLDLDEFDASAEQLTALEANCPLCTQGQLVTRTNKQAGVAFLGCTNYPRCKHTESPCPRCNAPMQRRGRFRVCLNDACGWWIPICPVSGGEMSFKKEYRFWGCSDYRSNDPNSCRHKERSVGQPPARTKQ
ncbi:helicase IV [Pseudomonas sp. T]|nr:helicase IV [Pseudomonas sp. T]